MSFASGKRSLAISDRSGQAFPYREMVKEWTGALVHISEFEPKHPQIDPPYHKADAVALQNPRTQRFQQPTDISNINPQAPQDDTIVSSGGSMVGIADLTLPGDFAFITLGAPPESIEGNNITTMNPADPSLQNRRRELKLQTSRVTVSIT